MSNIINVENLNFAYDEAVILRDLSFGASQGEFLAIAGPNGAGKTTLLNLICGLMRPKSGSIEIESASIDSFSTRKLAQIIAVVRQEFVPVFDYTVTEVVMMARTPYWGALGFASKADREIVAEALEITDIAAFSSRPLAQLSAGERQRVFIARALAQDTPILLLDEPTSFLDLKHQVGIYDLLKAAQLQKHKTILIVTHDINLASQYCDQILLIGVDCKYRFGQPKDVFSSEQIEKVFGVRTFAGEIGREKFFLPLGKFAKDAGIITPESGSSQRE